MPNRFARSTGVVGSGLGGWSILFASLKLFLSGLSVMPWNVGGCTTIHESTGNASRQLLIFHLYLLFIMSWHLSTTKDTKDQLPLRVRYSMMDHADGRILSMDLICDLAGTIKLGDERFNL